MAKIMVRKARNDFEAFLTAQAIEDIGATVISIAYDGQHLQNGALIESSKFVVFARVSDSNEIDAIDELIDLVIDGVYNEQEPK